MIIKSYKPLSNWLSWLGLVLMMGISPIIQAATDCNAVTEISTEECESLLELYNSTDGANWTNNSGWNVTNTPCSWYGITCSNGGVSEIVLSNNLKGTIPNFSSLPNLWYLFLYRNQLNGTIPNFSSLPNLEFLLLWDNQLSGTIPNFSALPKLKVLYLFNNKLSGTIPNFSALPNLQRLAIENNQLSGAIPNFNLPNLNWLSIKNNQLCKDKNTNYGTWQSTVNQYPDCPTSEPQTYTLSISSGNGGTVSPSPNKDSYNNGEIIELTATPEQCYAFTGWSDACSGTSSSCQLTMDSDKSVSANFQLQTYNLNLNSQNGVITTSPNGSSYDCGSQVTLTATPNTGYSFVRWEGDASGNNPNTSITMNSDKTITAIFEAETYNLSISSANGGSIYGSNKDTYNSGETVNLTAIPEQCYTFTDWGGDCSGTSSSCQLTMDTDKSVTANFQLQTYNLNLNSQNGIITTSPNGSSYDCGSQVTLTATPNTGYRFVRWEGYVSGNNPNTSITMNSDKTITAIFEAETYNLSISSANGGRISGSSKDSYNSGETVNLTATPEQCYAFTGWGGACSGTSSSCQLTMDSDKSVSANFEIQSFKLNISSDNGIVDRQPNKTVYDCGETVKLTARPYQGYKFTAWSGDANSTNESITVNMDTDLNLTAMFSKVQDLKIEPNFAEINLNGSQILTVSGGTEPYKWSSSNGGQLSPTSGKQVNFSANSSNSQGYHITVTDNNGETAQAIVKVYDLKVTPSGPLTLGFGETIKLTASGGRPKYNWTVTNGQLSAKQGSNTTYIAPNIAGDHIITVTDDRGEKVEVKVTMIAELICSPTIATVILGDPNPITFKAAGGAEPYKWSADNGIINPIEGSEANYQPPAQTGEYHVTCKDNKDSSIMSIVRVVPSVTITPTQIDLAAGAVTTLEVTGGQKPYIWNIIKGSGDLNTTEGSRVSYTAPTRNGIYTIMVMDALQQEAKARIQVLGNLIISPIKTVVAIGENVHLSVARGAEPYTWPDGSTGRTWNTKFNTVGRKEIVVTDAANDTALAIVEVIHDQLGLTPQNAYINPSEVINFSISGGTPPYVWNVEAGTLTSVKGTRVAYIAPNQPGKYNITVTDGRDVQGQAKIIVKADVIELKSGTARNDMGSISSNIIVDGVEHHENEILVDTVSNIDASFSLELPNDGQNYNTYGAIYWIGLEEQPVLFFKTSTQQELVRFDPNQQFPIYKTATAGEKVVVKNIYNGQLSNNTGNTLLFYAGYAPVGTNVLETLLFNATQPYNVLVK